MVPAEPPSYDGHREGTFGTVHPVAPHYNTLLRIDPTDRTGTRPVGDLADSWTISSDGLTYTFKLRQGVRFHDGSPMTSRDVKASYDKIIFPTGGVISARKGTYQAVEAVEAPDPQTVRFRLKWPEGSFLVNLASPFSWIFKADILARDARWYETNVMGTGPFKFVEHVKGSHWLAKKNPDYWDKGKPYLDGYRALFISSSSPQVAALPRRARPRSSAARARWTGTAPSRRSARRSRCRKVRGTASSLVAFNHERKPFDDKRVRRALTPALDRHGASRSLSRITVVKEVGGSRCRGHPWATPHRPSSRSSPAGRAGIDRREAGPRRGGSSGRPASPTGFAFTFKNRAPSRTSPWASGSSISGGRSGSTSKQEVVEASAMVSVLPERRLRRGQRCPVQFRRRARLRHLEVPVGGRLR
jgi:peptide/nickel transport system substrate-binding protein